MKTTVSRLSKKYVMEPESLPLFENKINFQFFHVWFLLVAGYHVLDVNTHLWDVKNTFRKQTICPPFRFSWAFSIQLHFLGCSYWFSRGSVHQFTHHCKIPSREIEIWVVEPSVGELVFPRSLQSKSPKQPTLYPDGTAGISILFFLVGRSGSDVELLPSKGLVDWY